MDACGRGPMTLLRDARHVLRSLLRSPFYTATAIIVLALAIAANTSIFSAVHAVLLKRQPMTDPGGLVIVWESDAHRGQRVVELSYRRFEQWAGSSRSFS